VELLLAIKRNPTKRHREKASTTTKNLKSNLVKQTFRFSSSWKSFMGFFLGRKKPFHCTLLHNQNIIESRNFYVDHNSQQSQPNDISAFVIACRAFNRELVK